jgi:hypothetical protein
MSVTEPGFADGVVEPATGLALINVSAYIDLANHRGRFMNNTPLYANSRDVRAWHIYANNLVFFLKESVANRGTQIPKQGLPSFQSLGGLGKIDFFDREQKSPEGRQWALQRAKAQLMREICLLGVAVKPVEAGEQDNSPPAYGVTAHGLVTVPWGSKLGSAGDVAYWKLPDPSVRSLDGRYMAELEPLSPEVYGDMALYLQTEFRRGQANIDFYERDRMGQHYGAPYDDHMECLYRLRRGMLQSSLTMVAWVVRQMLISRNKGTLTMKDGKIATAGGANIMALFDDTKLNKIVSDAFKDGKSVAEAQTAIEDATATIMETAIRELGLTSPISSDDQTAARQFITMAFIDPAALCQAETGVDVLKRAGAQRMGYLSTEAFQSQAKMCVFPKGKTPNSALGRFAAQQQEAFPAMVRTMFQMWQEFQNRIAGRITENVEPRKQVNLMLNIR